MYILSYILYMVTPSSEHLRRFTLQDPFVCQCKHLRRYNQTVLSIPESFAGPAVCVFDHVQEMVYID